jgi:hypothetical protein
MTNSQSGFSFGQWGCGGGGAFGRIRINVRTGTVPALSGTISPAAATMAYTTGDIVTQ